MMDTPKKPRPATSNNPPYPAPPDQLDPALNALVREIIGRVADKWTMLAIEVLEEHGRLRFTQVGEHIGGISQKMLTKTLRQMERVGQWPNGWAFPNVDTNWPQP